MSLLQINSAITANNKFFTKPEHPTKKHFPEVLTKATDGQYSLVELEQAKLGSDLSNCTWTKLLNFKYAAFQNKSTLVMMVLVDQISGGIYFKTTLSYSNANQTSFS